MDQPLAAADGMAELNQKIDLLTAQVQFLTEQALEAERQRQSRDELLRDLTPIANDAFRLAVDQLEEVQEYVDLDDLLRLIKRVLRNGRNVELMFDQMESALDLVSTVSPLSDEALAKAVNVLQEAERKGYFTAARGGLRIVDKVVTSFGEQDLQALGDNIVLILQTLKSMTQPEIMNFLSNTVQAMEGQKDKPLNTSPIALVRQMNEPGVRRGLALTLRVLRTIGAQTGPH